MADQSESPVDAPVLRPLPFSIAVEARRDAVKIAPRGELDLATIGQLQHALKRLIDTRPARIVIDLRNVEFLDFTGRQTLLTAHAQAQHDNWELTIIPGPPAVQRRFEISCTIDRLPFTTDNGRAATR